jgi:hypothetical protein
VALMLASRLCAFRFDSSAAADADRVVRATREDNPSAESCVVFRASDVEDFLLTDVPVCSGEQPAGRTDAAFGDAVTRDDKAERGLAGGLGECGGRGLKALASD